MSLLPDLPLIRTLRQQTRFASELSWVITGQVAVAIAGIVSVRLFTVRMGPEIYGQLSLGLTFAAFLNPILWGPLVQTYLRMFAPYREQRRLGVLLASLKPFVFGNVALLTVGSVVAFAGAGVIWSWQWGLLIASGLLCVLTLGSSSLCEAFQIASRRRAIVAAHQALNNWLRIPVVLILLIWIGKLGSVALLGYAVAGVVVLISQLYFLNWSLRPAIDCEESVAREERRLQIRTIHRRLWAFGAPFVPLSVFTWLQLYGDRWVLEFTNGTSAVGRYAVLVQVVAPIALLGNSTAQFVQPIVFARVGDGTDVPRLRLAHQFVNRCSLAFGILILVTVGGLWLIGAPILRWLAPPAFWGASRLLPLVGLAAGIAAIAQLQTILGFAHNRSKDYLIINGVTGVMGVVLAVPLATILGLTGVVLAALIVGSVRLAWSVSLGYRLRAPAGTAHLEEVR